MGTLAVDRVCAELDRLLALEVTGCAPEGAPAYSSDLGACVGELSRAVRARFGLDLDLRYRVTGSGWLWSAAFVPPNGWWDPVALEEWVPTPALAIALAALSAVRRGR